MLSRNLGGKELSSFDRRQFKIVDNVLFLSKTYPRVNHSYEELLWTYWEVCDQKVQREQGVLFLLEPDIYELTKAESIDRAWRKLVAEEKIKLTEEQKKSRESEQENYRQFYGQRKLFE